MEAPKRRRPSTLNSCDSVIYASPKNSCGGKLMIISSEFENAASTSIKISDMDAGGAGVGMMMPFTNLSDDLIADILSRLPVKCVLRCRCVCKSWQTITQQKFFIDKHQRLNKCSQIVYEYETGYKSNGDDQPYIFQSHCNGLVLEKNKKMGDYRIRNPATKQVLDQVPAVYELCRPIIGFDSSTGNYKVISLSCKGGVCYVVFETIGTDGDLARRSFDIPLCVRWARSIFITKHYDVCYALSFCLTSLKKSDIVRFTTDGKTSMKIKVPPSFHSILVRGLRDEHFKVTFLDDKLSVGFIVGQDLHLWVLENYSKHVWSEKKLIRLDFIKNYPNPGKIRWISSPSLGQLRFTIANHYLEYDIESTKYTCLAEVPPGKQFVYGLIPNLVSLKGMRSEEKNLSQRPRID